MSGKTVLILGGGIGGQVAANVLRKSLHRDHRVILVDRRREFVFSPSLLWVMVGQRKLDQISRPLEILSKKGIEVLRAEVTRINPAKKTVVAGEQTLSYGGQRARYDLLVAVPPHRVPRVVKEAGLPGETGWIPVDAQTLKTQYDGVYAIGDNTTILLPAGKPLPKAGVFAHDQAEVVAKNITAEIEGSRPSHLFNGRGYCFLEMGGGRAGFASGEFFATPEPRMILRRPAFYWHWGKVLFERWWLRHWF